jgi:hypothetical protein
MNSNQEYIEYNAWIKAATEITQAQTGRHITSIAGHELLYWFKSGRTAAEAAEMAVTNKALIDQSDTPAAVREQIVSDAKRELFPEGKRMIATGDKAGFTAVDLLNYPGYSILAGLDGPMKGTAEETDYDNTIKSLEIGTGRR